MAFTLDQIAELFDLQPYQRELLEAMIRRDAPAKAEKDSYRAKVEAEYERIQRWLDIEYGRP